MQAILHCDNNWGIGKKNDLMFTLPLDMKFFRKMTTGNIVVMGSNTLLSFPQSKPLKNRTNIVLWPNGDKERARQDSFIIADTLEELFSLLSGYDSSKIFVIGGAMMYHTLLPYCDKAYITKVDANGNADVFFDNLDSLDNWHLESASEPVDDNGYSIRFCTYTNDSPIPIKQL